MGETRHEIFRIRQDGDYPAGRAIAFAGSADPGKARHSQIVFLPLVRSVSARRTRSPRGSPLTAGSGLEPHPRGYPRSNCRPGAGSAGTEPARTGGALHGRGRIFCLGGLGYRLLKAHDLITSPAYIVIKAAEEFKDKTIAP